MRKNIRKETGRLRFSWRHKITLLVLCSVFGVVFITLFLNSTFLKKYYTSNKISSLEETYSEVSAILDECKLRYAEYINENGSIRIDDSSGEGRFVNPKFRDVSMLISAEEQRRFQELTNKKNIDLYFQWIYNTNEPAIIYNNGIFDFGINADINRRLQAYMYPGASNIYLKQDKIKEQSNYSIYQVIEGRTQTEYVDLFSADRGAGLYLIVRTNYEDIQSSAVMANQFMLYAGLSVGVIVSAILFFLTKSFTKPLENLNHIAKKMCELDFNVKYVGKNKDEVGELGDSINQLSEKLENTIVDLKTANNQLKNDIEQKQQIDDMRKEFLSNVTHELKTPIALIQGYAEGLKDNILDDPDSMNFYCDVIIDESAKMNKMVQQLLSLNSLEFGNRTIEMQRFDICTVIESVIGASDILIKQNNIKLYYKNDEPVFVWADAFMIEEVIGNYLSNAIHYVKDDNVIEIKTIKTDNNLVRVTVFNTGDPIPEDELDKIFIKFYKVDKARTREYGGSGIGLSIVKAIMEAHNMQYGVINHTNGVEFWFEVDGNPREE